jgi:hypothetical protein
MNTKRAATIPSGAVNNNPFIINESVVSSRASAVVQTCKSFPPEFRGKNPSQPTLTATILLFDSVAEHRESLRLSLTERGHRVSALDPTNVEQFAEFQKQLHGAGLVIFDLTVLTHEIWCVLRRVSQFRGADGLPLRVICPSRTYRGPAFELCVASLGTRVVYEC